MGDDYRTNGGSIIVQMGEALSYRWGTGRSPSPVDGHSLLPGRSLALGVSLLPHLGTGAKQLLPSMAVALSYRWGTGRSPSPVDGHSLLPGRSLALGVSLLPNLGTGAKQLLPSMAIVYSQGDPSPWESHYYPDGGQARSGCSRRRP